jgi:hypothetical protein
MLNSKTRKLWEEESSSKPEKYIKMKNYLSSLDKMIKVNPAI